MYQRKIQGDAKPQEVRKDSLASDSSSSSDEEGTFVPYNERRGWEDVQPLPQDDGPHPVVKIAYSDRFRNVFDYFRAVVARDERSERALKLTEECVSLNPANYTVWYYRRVILKDLQKDLWVELAFLEKVISNNPKNYQVWHHRKAVVEWLKDPRDEKQFTEKILSLDAKNYHAWQHRQWVVEEHKLWDCELDFVDTLIHQDVRNNSAWNHRHFVVSRETGFESALVLERELNFTFEKISLAPNNESPWNYLRGVLHKKGLSQMPQVSRFCDQLYAEPNNCRSPHLLSFIIDSAEETLAGQETPDPLLLEKAVNLADSLANKHDKIRREYWGHILRTLNAAFSV